MKINNKLAVTSLVPLAVLGFVGVNNADSTSAPTTEVANACPITVAEAGITEEEEQVFFVGCGGFF